MKTQHPYGSLDEAKELTLLLVGQKRIVIYKYMCIGMKDLCFYIFRFLLSLR